MEEFSGGGKLKREKIILDINFRLWEHETLELCKGLWGNKLHIDLLNFNYQTAKTMLFPGTNFLAGKLGIHVFSIETFVQCPLN